MDLSDFLSNQKKFSELIGVPGHEDTVSSFILEKVTPLTDKAWKDPLGNVLAIKYGSNSESGEKIMLDAHMDEVGFMISHVEPNGFLRFVPLGGFDERIFLAQSIVVRNNKGEIFHGTVGSKPPHLLTSEEKSKSVSISDMYLDIGMFSDEEIRSAEIDIGSVGTLYSPFAELPNDMIRGKALDDRVGCNILLEIAKIFHESEPIEDTLMFSFSVQEEVGLRGAKTAAYSLDPTIALAIETTTAADTPGIKDHQNPVTVGKGPSITWADNTIVSNPKVNKRLIENGKTNNIQFQFKKPKFGGNNAGAIHLSKLGVPTSVVSVPCRYLHTSVSMVRLSDVEGAIKLVESFIRNSANV